jgi:hypothetical protein
MGAETMGPINWTLTGVVLGGAVLVVAYLVVGLVRKGFATRLVAVVIPVVATCLVIVLFLYGYVGR